MTTSDISEDVRALLREHLTSFERLEIVLLLRAYPGQDWDVAAVSERTRIPPELNNLTSIMDHWKRAT